MDVLQELAEKVLAGKNKDVKMLCLQALEEGYSAEEILNRGLLAGMNQASECYRKDQILITHVLLAAGAMNVGTKILQRSAAARGSDPEKQGRNKGTVIIGTVKGDLHDIGKNLVKMMLESEGIRVIDLGVNVEPEAFVKEAIEQSAKVIACSVLLTTAMPMLGKVVEIAKTKGVRDNLKIMIGGAPVTAEFAKSIGADAYTDNAAEATEKALAFLGDTE